MSTDLQRARETIVKLIQALVTKINQDPLVYGYWINGRNHLFDPTDASLEQWQDYLISFDSYERSRMMASVLSEVEWTASDYEMIVRLFLYAGDVCDAPWAYRQDIASSLRRACAQVSLVDLLDPDERAFYEGLPLLVPVWRGCQRGRERGISWTTDRMTAEGFAWGKRCINTEPTLVRAIIPKQHIFAVFLRETEIALDFRRLRNLQRESLSTSTLEEHYELVRKQKEQSCAKPAW